MKKIKRIAFKKVNYEVELTEFFLENQEEILKNYNEFFYTVEDLDEYIDDLIESAERDNYGSEKANENTMLEGFGRVWVKSSFWNKIYKPTKEGWKEAEKGELPKCGIILMVDNSSWGIFVTSEKEIEEEYWDGISLDDFK